MALVDSCRFFRRPYRDHIEKGLLGSREREWLGWLERLCALSKDGERSRARSAQTMRTAAS